jgi:predicted Zn-dependent protease
MSATLLVLLLLLTGPQELEGGSEGTVVVDGSLDERNAIFERTPAALPRAVADAWSRFCDPKQRDAVLTELGPEFTARINGAELAYAEGRFPDVLLGLYSALEEKPDFPPALMLLGTAYFRLRRYADCQVALERFLEVAPSELWRTQALGHSYYSQGDYARARAHYEKILAALPADEPSVEALRGLALSHMRLGDPETALDLLDRVVELRPEHAEAHVFRARILHEQGALEPALAAAERARELAPYEPQGWYFSMRILFDLGRDEDALAAETRWREVDRVAQEVRSLEMQLRFRPADMGILMRLCELAAGIGDVQGARARLADLVRARPPEVPEVDVRILVLDVLEQIGDQQGAGAAASALEKTCGRELRAWERLERYFAAGRDRVNQMRAAAEVARLSSGGK